MITAENLRQVALDSGMTHTAVVGTSEILFHESVRKACEKNVCGKYNTNWKGPPAIGPIEELKKRVLQYRQGLLVQTVHQTNGSFDMEGMMAAAEDHGVLFRNFLKKIRKIFSEDDFLPLDAGCCNICEQCTYPTYPNDGPCRNPDDAVSSVEAYGMDVSALMKTAGLPYNHGKGAIGFVGMILF